MRSPLCPRSPLSQDEKGHIGNSHFPGRGSCGDGQGQWVMLRGVVAGGPRPRNRIIKFTPHYWLRTASAAARRVSSDGSHRRLIAYNTGHVVTKRISANYGMGRSGNGGASLRLALSHPRYSAPRRLPTRARTFRFTHRHADWS